MAKAKPVDYTPKTLPCGIGPRAKRNKIHPIAVELTGLFAEALLSNPPLPNTAWCIDLARSVIGWELVAAAEGHSELFVQNKIRAKIEKDKGVLIR